LPVYKKYESRNYKDAPGNEKGTRWVLVKYRKENYITTSDPTLHMVVVKELYVRHSSLIAKRMYRLPPAQM
jgi:hypothetical protein